MGLVLDRNSENVAINVCYCGIMNWGVCHHLRLLSVKEAGVHMLNHNTRAGMMLVGINWNA